MLYYILLVLLVNIILDCECFNSQLTPDEPTRTYEHTEVHNDALSQENMLWKSGDIPLLNRKIFKGMPVSIREHPYIASIRRHIVHYSMATILTKNLFLTVAHPLIDVPNDELRVVVGENFADRGATLLTVVLVVIHENFDRNTLAADLALLRVYEDTPYRCSVKAIELARPSQSLHDHQVFITGWGRCDRTGAELCLPRSSKYTPGETFDPMLRSVSFEVKLPNVYCEGYTRNGVTLQQDMLCLGPDREEDAVASCLAVPGAPLVVNGSLAALQSWGYGCGYEHTLPLVYTSLQYHRQWLLHNVRLLKHIEKQKLTLLFKAKRAYILSKWLNLTRAIRPEPFYLSEKPMKMLPVDRVLAKLRGQVLDIRDYLYDGIYHRYKTKLYEKLRQKLLEKAYLETMKQTVPPRVNAFLTDYVEEETKTVENLFLDTDSIRDQEGDYDE